MLRFIVFAILNFGALALGSIWAGDPSTNVWYQAVEKAPWTPPGWVFAAAWFSIMAAFTVYMWKFSESVEKEKRNTVYALFGIQWLLNVVWNPIFFKYHEVLPALVVIVSLFILVTFFMVWGFRKVGHWAWLMAPYVIWLAIAISLNAYVYFQNDPALIS